MHKEVTFGAGRKVRSPLEWGGGRLTFGAGRRVRSPFSVCTCNTEVIGDR